MSDFNKLYRSNEEGKREFIDEVIHPFVVNEGRFKSSLYTSNDYGEYILLYRYPYAYADDDGTTAAYMIDITADSIEAICRDFLRQYLKIIEKEN